ncbi:hypothetical protein [Natrarchaeobaculum sulfurireducens]|uniref:Uncharacterized protein n=1 Tax=Natrarchaeobaculum sulfurireducens TaxID=2044521 RepID=A0A346P9G2_9EURY|nr:hypothetical protein [Natrarchaeobaculum sulfurireducens]AXR76157.1 hypothetical protein AArc1_4040 [Natrarchaeobaculum sulfurireducens]
MSQESIRWSTPKEFASKTGKIIVALAGAMLMTGLLMLALPYTEYSPQTLERVIVVTVFYTTWMLLLFKLFFGKFIPLGMSKESET